MASNFEKIDPAQTLEGLPRQAEAMELFHQTRDILQRPTGQPQEIRVQATADTPSFLFGVAAAERKEKVYFTKRALEFDKPQYIGQLTDKGELGIIGVDGKLASVNEKLDIDFLKKQLGILGEKNMKASEEYRAELELKRDVDRKKRRKTVKGLATAAAIGGIMPALFLVGNIRDAKEEAAFDKHGYTIPGGTAGTLNEAIHPQIAVPEDLELRPELDADIVPDLANSHRPFINKRSVSPSDGLREYIIVDNSDGVSDETVDQGCTTIPTKGVSGNTILTAWTDLGSDDYVSNHPKKLHTAKDITLTLRGSMIEMCWNFNEYVYSDQQYESVAYETTRVIVDLKD